MENKHTYKEYTLSNGDTVKCTVAFKYLLELREKNKHIYKMVNDGLMHGVSDMADAAYILYGAYLCACYAGENGGADNAMSAADFVGALDDDLIGVLSVCSEFINKKKN